MKLSRKYLLASFVSLIGFVLGCGLLTTRGVGFIVGGYLVILGALFGIICFLEYGAAKDYERWEMKHKNG